MGSKMTSLPKLTNSLVNMKYYAKKSSLYKLSDQNYNKKSKIWRMSSKKSKRTLNNPRPPRPMMPKMFLWLKEKDLLESKWHAYLWSEISTKNVLWNFKKPSDGLR